MWWNEAERRYEAHPDCRCGQAEDWQRGKNRPCYCMFLRPLDGKGQPIPNVVIDGLREQYYGSTKEMG